MLIRICLILAVVAGLGALGITHFQVDKKLKDVVADRDQTRTQRDGFENDLKLTKEQLAATNAYLITVVADRDDAKSKQATAEDAAKASEAAKKTAESALASLKTRFDTIQSTLAKWTGLNKPFEAVHQMVETYPKLKDERDAFELEKQLLVRKLKATEAKLALYLDPDATPPELPIGLKGKIVQVDPKYQFVVLNIGGNQGVLERGEMLINRQGRLIGKVKITSVEPDRCVANVLKAWKQDEPYEGDEVLY